MGWDDLHWLFLAGNAAVLLINVQQTFENMAKHDALAGEIEKRKAHDDQRFIDTRRDIELLRDQTQGTSPCDPSS